MTRKILIIDDEEDFCHFVKLNMEKTGKFEVLVTANPKEGISLAQSNQPDLILLDILMPQMDGSQVAEELLQDPVTKKIPVVFLMPLAQKEGVKRGSGMIGGHIFIAKSVSPGELIARIEPLLHQEQ